MGREGVNHEIMGREVHLAVEAALDVDLFQHKPSLRSILAVTRNIVDSLPSLIM